MNNSDTEKKRARVENIVKVLGLGFAGLIAAPYVFLAIKGIVGLIAAFAIGWAVVFFTPYIARAAANFRLKLIKSEASKNPVETLQNDFIQRSEALSEFSKSISNFSSEVQLFADKLDGFITLYPKESEKFKMQLSQMRQLLKVRQNKYIQAGKDLKSYELEIEKAGAIWDMGQAAAAMNKASGMSQDDFFAKISVETALDSIQKNLNSAFAELETSLLSEGQTEYEVKEVRQLNEGNTITYDVPNTSIKAKVSKV